jgi:hypothetical protein
VASLLINSSKIKNKNTADEDIVTKTRQKTYYLSRVTTTK